MNLTTESLRRRMEQAYFDETGYSVDRASDVGLRFRLLAAELYSMKVQGDFILKQAFPQTAEGVYLDLHASSRGLSRKTASSAIGRLLFSVEAPAEKEIEIPVGTVCACSNAPYIRFATVQQVKIKVGNTWVEASARALDYGPDYNVPAGAVDLLVTPPAGICAVTNQRPLSGGYLEEDDRALRSRLLEWMRFRPNGFDRESYLQRLLTLEEVVDANVYRSGAGDALYLAVRTKSGTLNAALRAKIETLLSECLLAPVDLVFSNAIAQKVEVRLSITADRGFNPEQVRAAVKTAVEAQCRALRVGETFYPAALGKKISQIEGVHGFTFLTGEKPVTVREWEYVTVETVEVTADVW